MITKEDVINEVNALHEECCLTCKFWDIQQDTFNPEQDM